MDSGITLIELLTNIMKSNFNRFSIYLSKLSTYQIVIVIFMYIWITFFIYVVLYNMLSEDELISTRSKFILPFVLSTGWVLLSLRYCRIIIFMVLVIGFILSVLSEIGFAVSLGGKIIDCSLKKGIPSFRFYLMLLITMVFIIKIALIILQIKIPILVYVFMAMTMIINLIGLFLGMEEESPFFISREVLHGSLKLLHAILTAIIAIVGVQLFFPIVGIILDITFLITLIFCSVQYFSIFFD